MKLGLLKRWQRWALLFLLGVGLLWGGSWAVIPSLVHWQLEKQGAEWLGRTVKLTQVEFRPWSMALIVHGLRIGKAGTDNPLLEPQLTVEEIEVNVALETLIFLAPVADAIRVRNPQLHFTHLGQGRFDTDDVLQRLTSTPTQRSVFPRMSLFNIQVTGGDVQFFDQPKAVTHALTELQLDIPFLSNIGSRREVATHPRLAFKLNGSVFDSDAETTPFRQDRHTQAHFQIKGLNAAAYLPYWPAAWPVRLADGRLDMDITLDFRQKVVPELVVSGQLALKDLRLTEITKTITVLPLLQFPAALLTVQEWRPLESVIKLDGVRLEQPVVDLRRDQTGALNWDALHRFFASSERAGASSSPSNLQFALKKFEISGGELRWQDESTHTPVAMSLKDIDLESKGLSWPSQQVAPVSGTARFAGAGLSWQGVTDFKSAQMNIQWIDLSLQSAAAYWAEWLQPELSGKSSSELSFDWRAEQGSESSRLLIKSPLIRINDIALLSSGKAQATLTELSMEQIEVDVLNQQALAGRVTLSRPVVTVSRHKTGCWMFDDWLKAGKSEPLGASVATKEAKAASPWQFGFGALQILGGEGGLDDRFLQTAVKFDVRDVNLSAGPWKIRQPPLVLTPLRLDLKTGKAGSESGRVSFDGAVQSPPLPALSAHATQLQVKGKLQIDRFPLHQLSPYGAEWVKLDLNRADLNYLGVLDVALPTTGMSLNLKGELSFDHVRALAQPTGEELLDIKSFNLRGLDLAFKAGVLSHLKISESALNDFFARVEIDSSGHLNWQGLLKQPAASSPQTSSEKPLLTLGPLGVVGGRILFSDHYIQPNYSASLSDVAGGLGAFTNQSRDAKSSSLAELNLRGRVQGSASLELTGHINPLTQPVALDVKGKVRDLELPELSAYSSKYAGYGIERGKLSADVNYRIDDAAKLQATHQLVLNQLRFGDRSTSPDAPNLPVKLAVALLADRHGVININLPVSGSLQDPDFSVGAIVWKLFLGLIGKAVLSPFNLLAGAFSSEEQLQQIDFMPGSALLDVSNRKKLEKVAGLLVEKPALNLTVVGEANLESEREALRSAKLLELLKAEKNSPSLQDRPVSGAEPEMDPAEYLALLKSAYRRSPIPKPRNVLGLIKDLPQADMEALLLASLAIDESDLRDLAATRAQGVRDLLATLGVSQAQLFLGASLVGNSDNQKSLLPRVNLTVSID